MSGFTAFLEVVQIKAIVTALLIQVIVWAASVIFRRHPRLFFTMTNSNHFIIQEPREVQSQSELPLEIAEPIKTTERTSSGTAITGENTFEPPAGQQTTRDIQYVNVSVYTANYSIMNEGKLAAKNLEISFNYTPRHYTRFPHVPIRETTLQDGRFVMTVGMLNPKEQLMISLLNVNETLPAITLVRCEGYGSTRITTIPMRVWPKWFYAIVALLMLFGAFSFFYFVSLLIYSNL